MPLSIQFGKPHDEAFALIKGKPAITREVFDRLLPELRARAFTVTGITGINILERIRDEIAALPAGTTWDDAKANIADLLDQTFLDPEVSERRAELLLRTHGFQAFEAANWRVAQADDDTTHLQYMTMEDDRVRPSHAALDGLILPKDDPFWDTHTPPWDWGCRCSIRPLNPDQVAEFRAKDQKLPPEARLVLEGPALEQLRHGTRITPEGQRVDVTPPSQKAGGETAFRWHPEDFTLHWERLQNRYADAPEVWAVFEDWATRTHLPNDGRTVKQWLSGFESWQEAASWADRQILPRLETFNQDGRQALLKYQLGSRILNAELITDTLRPEWVPWVKNLDAALNRAPALPPLTVFRGLSRAVSMDLRIGQIWEQKNFLSTSLCKERARLFATRGELLEITIPPGKRGFYFDNLFERYAYEVEILFARGAKLKVIDIKTEGPLKIIQAIML